MCTAGTGAALFLVFGASRRLMDLWVDKLRRLVDRRGGAAGDDEGVRDSLVPESTANAVRGNYYTAGAGNVAGANYQPLYRRLSFEKARFI